MTYSSYSVRVIYLHYTFSTHYNIYIKGKEKQGKNKKCNHRFQQLHSQLV